MALGRSLDIVPDAAAALRRTGKLADMRPRHIAFLPFPAFGHINPTVPVVAELIRRGHRVSYATNARFADLVAATGAQVLRYESRLADRPPPEQITAEYMVREPVRSIDEAIATLPGYLVGFGNDKPDVLLYDVSTFAAGRVLARLWKRPAIEMFATFASNERYSLTQRIGARFADQIDRHHPALIDFFVKQGQLLADYGLADVTLEEFNAPADDANLVFLPRSFQPAQESFDQRFTFVGAAIGHRPEPTEWRPPADGRPVLLVCLGTFGYEDRRDFLRECLTVAEELPWHVVMSIGDQLDPAELGAVPDNVELLRWVPQLTVLPHASAFVTHGGMNSVMEALYFGTPLVAVPHMPEQHLVAERLAELGLGRYLPRPEATASRLREAVLAVAGDERVRQAVAAIRAELRTAGGPALAADVIESRAYD